MSRGRLKSLVGVVSSNRMDKTVTVDVVRIRNNPRYGKQLKKTSTIKAHDESNQCNIGDKVMIVESKPISKTKSWRVSKVLEQGSQILQEIEQEPETIQE